MKLEIGKTYKNTQGEVITPDHLIVDSRKWEEVMKLEAEEYKMDFEESLVYLGIEKYRNRIFESSSNGELYHLGDYMMIANNITFKDSNKFFVKWFDDLVARAKNELSNPELVFMHVLDCFNNSMGANK